MEPLKTEELTMADRQSWIENNLRLIEMEKQAEIESNKSILSNLSPLERQRKGVCLTNLSVVSSKTGLGGRCIIRVELHSSLKKNNNKKGNSSKSESENSNGSALPAHKFRTGDIVVLKPEKQQPASEEQPGKDLSGTVCFVKEDALSLALDLQEDLPSWVVESRIRLDKTANDITYKRYNIALKKLEKDSENELARILFDKNKKPSFKGKRELNSLLEEVFKTKNSFKNQEAPAKNRAPGIASDGRADFFVPYNPNLNQYQIEAVKFALRANDYALIHGPPGTGKTMCLIEIIRQLVHLHGKQIRILVCGPSNISVDNIVERLGKTNIPVVRIGHPARVLESVLPYCLDNAVLNSDGAGLVRDIRQEMDKLIDLKNSKKKKTAMSRREMGKELRLLRKEVRDREKNVVKDILDHMNVVCCTLTGADSQTVRHRNFDFVIIDEGSQAVEAACWIPILKAKTLIMAGDHCQLPPTIMSEEAGSEGLRKTLFERLPLMHGESVRKMLKIQYRMNKDIVYWSNTELYASKLISDTSVESHLLSDLPDVISCDETTSSLFCIDTTGCCLYEDENPEDESKSNPGEAEIVKRHVQTLLDSGVQAKEIAVITPYNGQVNELKQQLGSIVGLEIGSVDGFQGREKEAVIISFVRSNDDRNVGFLSDKRRLNVAITRARRHCCIVCDCETVGAVPFIQRLTDHFLENGEVRSGEEYMF